MTVSYLTVFSQLLNLFKSFPSSVVKMSQYSNSYFLSNWRRSSSRKSLKVKSIERALFPIESTRHELLLQLKSIWHWQRHKQRGRNNETDKGSGGLIFYSHHFLNSIIWGRVQFSTFYDLLKPAIISWFMIILKLFFC